MDNQTLNDSGVNQEVGGIVNPDSPQVTDSLNTISDLDGAPSATDDKGSDKDQKADDKSADKADEERFDKHPRFQQLMKDREELRLKLARQEGREEARAQTPKPEEKVVLPFKDINAMTAEQIAEWQTEDPKGYAANLKAQARWEAEQSIWHQINARSKQAEELGTLKKTYELFEAKNPEFRKMWDSGEIIAFMEKTPGHNPISAYHEMTLETRMADTVAKAKKDAEETVTKRFLAKQKATVLTGGPSSHTTPDADPKLSNTRQHGGLNAVLADKLAAMRRAG